jgi:hypothetical protein
MYFVDIMDNMLTSFMGPKESDNDYGTTDNRPRNINGLGVIGQVFNFAKTLYGLTR